MNRSSSGRDSIKDFFFFSSVRFQDKLSVGDTYETLK